MLKIPSKDPSYRYQLKPKRKIKRILNPMYDLLFKKSDYRKDFEFEMNIHVETLAFLNKHQASRLINITSRKPKSRGKRFRHSRSVSWLDQTNIDLATTYPFKNAYLIPTEPTLDNRGKPMSMNVGILLWQGAQAYKNEFYRYPKKYGVWGHALGDLHFEVLILKKINGKWIGVLELGS